MKMHKKTVAETFGELNEQQREYVNSLFREGLERGVFPNPDDGNPTFRSFTEEQKKVVRDMIKLNNIA